MPGKSLKTLVICSTVLVAATAAALAQTAPAPQPGATPDTGKRRGQMAACRVDMKALCGSVPRGGGAKMKCLVENRAKVSPECQAIMATIEDRLAKRAARKAP